MTSVARLMASTKDSRQPYRLSNFDLVTESLTLNAGNASSPALARLCRRLTPLGGFPDTPLILASRVEYHLGSAFSLALMAANRCCSSSLPGLAMTLKSFSALEP